MSVSRLALTMTFGFAFVAAEVWAFDSAVEQVVEEAKRNYPPGDYERLVRKLGPDRKYVMDEKTYASPNGEFLIRTLRADSADEMDASAIIEIVRRSNDHALVSVREPSVRVFEALWAPDSALVAVSFKTETNSGKMRVFSVSEGIVSELELPEQLDLKKLLPPGDPARNFSFQQVKISPIQWQSQSDLICEIVGAGRRADPLNDEEEAMPTTAFATVGYRLTIRFEDHKSSIRAAEQAAREINE